MKLDSFISTVVFANIAPPRIAVLFTKISFTTATFVPSCKLIAPPSVAAELLTNSELSIIPFEPLQITAPPSPESP